jgi:uncharacterized coiled-coil protein SlyX
MTEKENDELKRTINEQKDTIDQLSKREKQMKGRINDLEMQTSLYNNLIEKHGDNKLTNDKNIELMSMKLTKLSDMVDRIKHTLEVELKITDWKLFY